MSDRPTVMSIAGFDPSGGAGILADIKTFEQHKVHGIAVCTAQTLQTESRFESIRWERAEDVLSAIQLMLQSYNVEAVKIGIVPSVSFLLDVVRTIHLYDAGIRIVVDPVIRSTTEYDFWKELGEESALFQVLEMTTLITPNFQEAAQLLPGASAEEAAETLADYCAVLLKGGHNDAEPGADYLYTDKKVKRLSPESADVFPKHGSGCVLSSAIAANLALGCGLGDACRKAKSFTEKFLGSSPSLIGHHVS